MNLAHNIDDINLRPYLRPPTGQHYTCTSKDLVAYTKSSNLTNLSMKVVILEDITLYYTRRHLVLY